MRIGEAARAAGVSVKMEQGGRIPAARRSDAGCRIHTRTDAELLRFVRRARVPGFSSDEIGEPLAPWRDKHRARADVTRLAEAHLADLCHKISTLQETAHTLEHPATCIADDHRPDCLIPEDLAGIGARADSEA